MHFFKKSEYLVKYIGEFNWSVTLSLFETFYWTHEDILEEKRALKAISSAFY